MNFGLWITDYGFTNIVISINGQEQNFEESVKTTSFRNAKLQEIPPIDFNLILE
jgi:hypothetical protein